MLALVAAFALLGVAAAPGLGARGGRHASHAKRSHKPTKKKRKAHRKPSTSRGAKGAKGDKGDRGDKGDPGASGSSIVARARLAAPTSTGDGGDEVALPLTGNAWTAAPDEAEDFAGTISVTVPAACDAPADPTDPFAVLPPELAGGSAPGYTEFGVRLDGREFIGGGFVDWTEDEAGRTVTVPLRFNGRSLNGDAAVAHRLDVLTYDACAGDGQSFTVTDLRINVYGMR